MELLKQLVDIHAPSGEEYRVKDFILEYVETHKAEWTTAPQIIQDGLQDGLILIFGKPRTAVYAHMDSIGFTVGYDNELIKIGGPSTSGNWELVGRDSQGIVNGTLITSDDSLKLQCKRKVDRGTSLTFKSHFEQTENYIQSPYIDNRLGVYNALKLCKTLEHGAIAFTCFEEHKGGSAQFLAGKLYQEHGISQALISDITWVTQGVIDGDGVAISIRDGSIPRRRFIDHIIGLAAKSDIPYQIEVESSGGSDGTAIQLSPYPIDWCFIGAPENNVHTPLEKVHKKDIESMLALYKYLMDKL